MPPGPCLPPPPPTCVQVTSGLLVQLHLHGVLPQQGALLDVGRLSSSLVANTSAFAATVEAIRTMQVCLNGNGGVCGEGG